MKKNISVIILTISLLNHNACAFGLFNKLKETVTKKPVEIKENYTPQVYSFKMPKVEESLKHNMKVIYTPITLATEGSTNGLESQLNSFKNALDKGMKDIIKAKKFNIYHEIEDASSDVSKLSQSELLKLAMQMQKNDNIDETLKTIPYVKKKRSSALIKTYIGITLKYELSDSSNELKKILVGNKIKTGYLYFSGEVGVEYIEPMTKEILVQQKFKLKNGKAPVKISYNDQSGIIKWKSNNISGAQIYSTDHVKALDKLLHDSYTEVLTNYFEYLSPEELVDLKEIINELKNKKKY